MSSNPSKPGEPAPGRRRRCKESAGFLFSHRCENQSVMQCTTCNRPICQRHALQTEQGALCVTCGKRQRVRKDGEHTDDPYLFASVYYHCYGYYGQDSWAYAYYAPQGTDPHDFTEADGVSLTLDDEDFEHDMGAS